MPEGKTTDFRILLIADAFSRAGYGGTSARIKNLLPNTSASDVLSFQPNIFFVESAWQGVNDEWHGKLSPPGAEVIEYLTLCKLHGIPSIFWNKEDPVHFGTFISLAKYFDYVATTDIDCIPRYMKVLGHGRVFLLPFAAQPRLQTPLLTHTRSNGFSFAGSWYQRYPERQNDFRKLLKVVLKFGQLDIYDRNYHSQKTETQFPAEYAQFIKGNLAFDEIDRAYKGYRFALNINTVKHSQSMFARRVFELMCSNTLVISNASKGMRIFFGDLILSSDEPEALETQLKAVYTDHLAYRKRCLLALRKVLSEHTYEHRLEYLKAQISSTRWTNKQPTILVLACVEDPQSEINVIANFKRQVYPCRLHIWRKHATDIPVTPHPAIHYFDNYASYRHSVMESLQELNWTSFFSAEDTYGEHFLTDLALATSFSDADAIGKAAHFAAHRSQIILIDENHQYRSIPNLDARAALIKSSKISDELLESWLTKSSNLIIDFPTMVSVDEFNYCKDGSSLPVSQVLDCIQVVDLENMGLSLAYDVLPIAERLTAQNYRMPIIDSNALQIGVASLNDWFSSSPSDPVIISKTDDTLLICSNVPASDRHYIQAPLIFNRTDLNLRTNNSFRLIADHNLVELSTVILFLDSNGIPISQTVNSAGSSYSLIVPDHCAHLKISLCVSGPGVARIHAYVFGKTYEQPAALLDKCSLASKLDASLHFSRYGRTGASAMSIVNQAQAAFDNADYQLAIDLYERAMLEQPELAHTYVFALNRAKKYNDHTPSASAPQSGVTTLTHDLSKSQVRLSKSTTSLTEIYHTIKSFKTKLPPLRQTVWPLVSFVMVARNSAEYIEESVTSVLRQNWPKIHLVIIDDGSTDQTWKILERLSNSVSNVVCRRINCNLGAKFALNYALSLTQGDYIILQNGGDTCHPDRTALVMSELERPHVVAVRCSSACVSTPSTEVIPAESTNTLLELFTTAFHRRVIDGLGNLDFKGECVKDFSRRLDNWAFQHALTISTIQLPLYYATIDNGNYVGIMAPDNLENDNYLVESCPSKSLEVTHRLDILNSENPHQSFRFPNLIKVKSQKPSADFDLLTTPTVVACICSIPERAQSLPLVLNSLAPQVDSLHIYLDRYEFVPDFLSEYSNQSTIYLSKDHPGLRDNGKFLPFAGLAQECYYFTVDDDIIYPPDYVASMVSRIEYYGKQAVIGVHGVLIPEQPNGYYTSYRKVHAFNKELQQDALVNNLGTGTVAFHSTLLKGLSIDAFPTSGMADLHFSVFCKNHDIPMISLARPNDWLLDLSASTESLYSEFCISDNQQSALVIDNSPWGYAPIIKSVQERSACLGSAVVVKRLQQLIPKLHWCLK